MENNVDVKSVLEELGYKLVDCGDSWRTSAIYRGGDNPTAVKVYKNTGVWTDYVHTNKSMPLAALVQRTLNTKDPKLLNKYISTKKNRLNIKKLSTNNIQDKKTSQDSESSKSESIKAIALIRAYRIRGHLIANLDPLGMMERKYLHELHPEDHGFKKEDYNKKIFLGSYMDSGYATINEIL